MKSDIWRGKIFPSFTRQENTSRLYFAVHKENLRQHRRLNAVYKYQSVLSAGLPPEHKPKIIFICLRISTFGTICYHAQLL